MLSIVSYKYLFWNENMKISFLCNYQILSILLTLVYIIYVKLFNGHSLVCIIYIKLLNGHSLSFGVCVF